MWNNFIYFLLFYLLFSMFAHMKEWLKNKINRLKHFQFYMFGYWIRFMTNRGHCVLTVRKSKDGLHGNGFHAFLVKNYGSLTFGLRTRTQKKTWYSKYLIVERLEG